MEQPQKNIADKEPKISKEEAEKVLKPELISTQLQKAVTIAKGFDPEHMTVQEYDVKIKRFEEDVKEAYPDLDLKTIKADFEGYTARGAQAEGMKGTQYVGMDPKDFPRSGKKGYPTTMEERLHMNRQQAAEAKLKEEREGKEKHDSKEANPIK